MLLLVAGARLQLQLDPEPSIRFVWLGGYSAKYVFRTDYYTSGRTEVTPIDEELDFVGVEVANDSGPAESTIHDAIAELSFYPDGPAPAADSEQPVLNTDGRWTFNPQPITKGPFDGIQDLKRRTLRPNGEKHRIDIATKLRSEADFWGASTHFWTTAGHRDERLRLTESSCRVRVSVTGVGMRRPLVGWFRVSNLGLGLSLDIQPLEAWTTEPIPGLPEGPAPRKEAH